MRRAWLELTRAPVRFFGVAATVAVGVAFVVACLVFTATSTAALGARLTAVSSTSDVSVQLPDASVPAELTTLPGAASAASTTEGYVQFGTPAGPGLIQLQSLPERPEFRWSVLETGRWPADADEVAVSTATADSYRLDVGDTLTMQPGEQGQAATVLVVGVLDQPQLLFDPRGDLGVVAPAFFSAYPHLGTTTLLLRTAPGTSPEQLAGTVAARMPAGTTVRTAEQASAEALTSLTGTKNLFGLLTLTFGGVAVLVAALTVVNIQSIVLAQRRREIALLRAVGAGRAQVLRRVLAEALLTGLLGSLVGVGLGLGLAAVAAAVGGSLGAGLRVPWPALVAVVAGAVLLTVLASRFSARRTARIAPVEALRPVDDAPTRRRSGLVRGLVGLAALVLGGAVIGYALRSSSGVLALAVAGSMVAAVGILLAAGLVAPALLGLVGRLVVPFGPTARLAAANLRRNPGRATATVTALMLAVGLVVTLQVGAASVQRTSSEALEQRFPVDLVVSSYDGPLEPTVPAAVAEARGVRAVAPVRWTTAEVAGSDGFALTVAAPGAGADRVVARGLDALGPGVALASPQTLTMLDAADGDPLTLVDGRRRATVTLVASRVAADGELAVTDATLALLDPDTPVNALWVAADDGVAAAPVLAAVRQATAGQPELDVGGSLPRAAELETLIGTLLTVATSLLGVAALIALIGVGSALGLSVLERTRESALLRALGLQRRQLRGMLAVEAALLAVVGAAVGVVAGVAFGVVGTAAVARETSMGALVVGVPVGPVLTVVAVAALAGAVASVLPARRAVRTSPTEALAAG